VQKDLRKSNSEDPAFCTFFVRIPECDGHRVKVRR
jgi:hypothetical protein